MGVVNYKWKYDRRAVVDTENSGTALAEALSELRGKGFSDIHFIQDTWHHTLWHVDSRKRVREGE